MNPALALFGAVVVALVVFVYSIIKEGADGKINRRRLGIRFAPVTRDEHTWQRGHAAALLPARIGLVGACALVAISLFWVRSDDAITGIVMAIGLAFGVVCVVWAIQRARTRADRADD